MNDRQHLPPGQIGEWTATIAVLRLLAPIQSMLSATNLTMEWCVSASEGLIPTETRTLLELSATSGACLTEVALLPIGLSQRHRQIAYSALAMAAALHEVRVLLSVVNMAEDQQRPDLVHHLVSEILPRLTNEGKSLIAPLHALAQESDNVLSRANAGDQLAIQAIALAGRPISRPQSVSSLDDTLDEVHAESLREVMSELNELTGLAPVKEQITGVTNLLNLQRRRRKLGLKTADANRHMVFVGSPGTGKTTVARLVGRIFRALELLPSGHLVEVARDDLVAGYVGQTAIKTNEVIDRALGGVLFIDEAYSLAPADLTNDFGREAIEALLKRMEDDRDRFVLIAAGYNDEMQRFLSANPGLRSRFAEVIDFPDYQPSELNAILDELVKSYGYELAASARAKASEAFELAWTHRDRSFGNARMVRNYFEDSLTRQANRLAQVDDADANLLSALEPDDLPDRPT